MTEYNYKIVFLAANQTEGHDKVWGYARIGDDEKTLYNFWGRRGKHYTFKRYEAVQAYSGYGWHRSTSKQWVAPHDLVKKQESKTRTGGYREVDLDRIEQFIPGFNEEFTDQLALARIMDNFHGES